MPAAKLANPLGAGLAIGSGVMSMGAGLIQAISAGKRAKEIERQINNYQRQTLMNPYERLQVSTLGSDLQRADLARTMATGMNQLSAGGSRALVGGMTNMLEQQRQQEGQIAANLDQQYNQIEQLKAQGDGMVQGMQEQREKDDLLGMGQRLMVEQQNKASGINAVAQGAASLGMAAASGVFGKGDSSIGASRINKDGLIKTKGGWLSPFSTYANSISPNLNLEPYQSHYLDKVNNFRINPIDSGL